ncbi:hypothetical protein P8452_14354 [Trifolium repens]|nr:hypothetical protein P8452_14354 [Trifolium repens]
MVSNFPPTSVDFKTETLSFCFSVSSLYKTTHSQSQTKETSHYKAGTDTREETEATHNDDFDENEEENPKSQNPAETTEAPIEPLIESTMGKKLWVEMLNGNRNPEKGMKIKFITPKVVNGEIEVEIDESDIINEASAMEIGKSPPQRRNTNKINHRTRRRKRNRSSLFFKISGGLKSLAEKFGLVVVVTNQVVDFIEENENVRIGNFSELYSSGRRVCPALGISWANCVNSRVFLSKGEECSESKMRRFRVVFAPHLPQFCSEFVTSEKGVFGVEMGQRNV